MVSWIPVGGILFSGIAYAMWPAWSEATLLRYLVTFASATLWFQAHAAWMIPTLVAIAGLVVLFYRDVEYINRRRYEIRRHERRRKNLVAIR